MPAAAQLVTDRLPSRSLLLEGEEYLYCSGTSYLGMACNAEFRQLLAEGIGRYGTNYSSSRLSNLQLQVYEEAEEYLATYTGAGAALAMSSGFLAAQALVQVLQGQGRFLYAPGTHPALWRSPADAPDARMPYEAWVTRLLEQAPDLPDERLVVVCNSLDALQAQAYDFSWLNALPQHKQVTVVIDDSHGLGITGVEGGGVYSMVQPPAHVRLVVVSSMGKALGIPAGVILGDSRLLAQLKSSAYFGGASPAIPAYLYAFLQAGPLYTAARARLHALLNSFREQLACPAMFQTFAGYPVFSTKQAALCTYLMAHKVLISSFRYPTPADAPITRVILNSLHTVEDVAHLADLINQFAAVPQEQASHSV